MAALTGAPRGHTHPRSPRALSLSLLSAAQLERAQLAAAASEEKSRSALQEVGRLESAAKEREARVSEALVSLAARGAELEADSRRRRLASDSGRLGGLVLSRQGASELGEAWEDGPAFRELDERQRAIQRSKEVVEAERRLLKARARGGASAPAPLAPPAPPSAADPAHALAEEGFKVRVLALTREDAAIKREQERLEEHKKRHQRELRRVRDEDAARFKVTKCTLLGGRYVLQSLLGRGGFSEVYKAYDIQELRYVACKIHQLVAGWGEERKRSYVRHAAREYGILKRMDHESIVRLHDVFEIDDDSFCTVLELCEGGDLDFQLRLNGTLGEREARCLAAQLFSGLLYLSEGPRRVIHYDLKPANILFDSLGRVKITDFGLSKVWEADGGGGGSSEGLELTSQGAGTYWYLPPECFETGAGGAGAPKISAKVDVWSLGVIFFQMLYGRRPFGHELTQEKILREETILRAARQLDFPDKPTVSAEAKAFIRRCLTYRQAERPDVAAAASDPYISDWVGKGAAAAALVAP